MAKRKMSAEEKALCERFMARPDVAACLQQAKTTPGVTACSIDRGAVEVTLQLGPRKR